MKKNPAENPNYACLPPDLASALPNVDWDAPRPTDSSKFNRTMAQLHRQIAAWDEGVANPYHNHTHMRTVLKRVTAIANACSVDMLPEAAERALQIAALGHDLCHPGFSDRQAAPTFAILYPNIEGITNERASNLAVYEIMRQNGVSNDIMILVWGMIESTLFFGEDPGAHNELEQIIRACDIAVDYENPADWIWESARVLEEATPVTRKPLKQWLGGRKWFLENWVRPRMSLVPQAMQLWGGHLINAEKYIEAALAGDAKTLEEIDGIVGPLLPNR